MKFSHSDPQTSYYYYLNHFEQLKAFNSLYLWQSSCSQHAKCELKNEFTASADVEKKCSPCCITEPGRKFFVAGNWKMYGTKSDINRILKYCDARAIDKNPEVVVCVPSCYLAYVQKSLNSRFQVGAQNCYKVDEGPFTGEISPSMLRDLHIPWVLLGQSERRLLFKETDELISEKMNYAVASGMKVIGCVGETEADKKSNKQAEAVCKQVKAWTECMPQRGWNQIVVAYEPFSAGGSCSITNTKLVQEIHKKIRDCITKEVNEEVGKSIRIIYGGNVSSVTAPDLAKLEDVDGFLVSGSALKPEFKNICNVNKPSSKK